MFKRFLSLFKADEADEGRVRKSEQAILIGICEKCGVSMRAAVRDDWSWNEAVREIRNYLEEPGSASLWLILPGGSTMQRCITVEGDNLEVEPLNLLKDGAEATVPLPLYWRDPAAILTEVLARSGLGEEAAQSNSRDWERLVGEVEWYLQERPRETSSASYPLFLQSSAGKVTAHLQVRANELGVVVVSSLLLAKEP